MVDHIEISRRSANMSAVRGKDTAAELAVRELILQLGFRYRLHAKDLPGTPDIAFRGRRKVIFVNGCLWHRHPDCPRAKLPKSNVLYWGQKIQANVERDERNLNALEATGWNVLIVWACELRSEMRKEILRKKLQAFLEF